tara:strand:+ start:776 stop:1333 length:558 start_codon:yes stop_codon:yes gene_type:complete
MSFISELDQITSSLEQLKILEKEINKITDIIIKTAKNGNCVFIAGNGGSAADAQHFAAELIVKFNVERSAIPAIALTTDSSVITAISNDFGFESVFTRQLEGLIKPNDVLFCFSTSGESVNIINAVQYANKKRATTISLTGKTNNQLSKISLLSIKCPSSKTAIIQTMHQAIYHYICGRIEKEIL